MSLTNVTRQLTAGERAREPRLMHVVAWFDGWGQAQGLPPMLHPRRLTPSEAESWREGWRESLATPTFPPRRAVSGPLADEKGFRAKWDGPDGDDAGETL